MNVGVSGEFEPALAPAARSVELAPEAERISSVAVVCSTSAVRISGALLCACRAAFVECGTWETVRLDLAGRLQIDVQALDELRASDWLQIEALTVLLDTQLAYMDLDALKARVRRQVVLARGPARDDIDRFEHGHVYAPMLRSWARSFASPEHMLRALGPLLRAGLRNVEVPLVRGLGASEAHVLLRGTLLTLLRGSESLRAAFEGLLLGLLDLARPQPLLPEVELALGRDEPRAVCRF
jgi:hypothetical protein